MGRRWRWKRDGRVRGPGLCPARPATDAAARARRRAVLAAGGAGGTGSRPGQAEPERVATARPAWSSARRGTDLAGDAAAVRHPDAAHPGSAAEPSADRAAVHAASPTAERHAARAP